jgi:prophage regulatory protein
MHLKTWAKHGPFWFGPVFFRADCEQAFCVFNAKHRHSMETKNPAKASVLRRPDVERLTGLSYSTIYRMMRAGTFPQRIKLSPQAVGWNAMEVAHWVKTRQPVPTPTDIPTR